MTSPAISVLMTVYNAERYLRLAVKSILDQSFQDFEFIIVDDGSTDNSINIITTINDLRIRLIRAAHAGLVPALNLGLGMVQGRYVARMDADDIAHPDRLAVQIAHLQAHPQTGLVCSDVRIINADGHVVGIQREPGLTHEWLRDGLLLRRRMKPVIHPSVMMRREVCEALGGYRAFDAAEDHDFWLRALDWFEFDRLNQTLLDYRIHPGGISREKGFRQEVSSAMTVLTWLVRQRTGIDIFDQCQTLFNVMSGTIHRRLEKEVIGPALAFRAARSQLREGNSFRGMLAFAKAVLRHGPRALPDGARKGKQKIIEELVEQAIIALAQENSSWTI